MTSYTTYNVVIAIICLAGDVVRTPQSLPFLVAEYIFLKFVHMHMAQKESYNEVALDYNENNESNDAFALKHNEKSKKVFALETTEKE
jgi:flagellar biosynthesis protein FliP